MALPRSLVRLFFDIGGKPTAEENRLYDCMKAIPAVETDLKARISLPELNEVVGSAKRNTETWCFDILLKDKLQEKGWPVFPQQGQDAVLCDTISILTCQANDRTSFDMVLRDYKKKAGAEAEAVKFLCDHVSDLEEVIAGLKTFTPGELLQKHKCILVVESKLQSSAADLSAAKKKLSAPAPK